MAVKQSLLMIIYRKDIQLLDRYRHFLVKGARVINIRPTLMDNLDSDELFEIGYNESDYHVSIELNRRGQITKVNHFSTPDNHKPNTLIIKYNDQGGITEFREYIDPNDIPEVVTGIMYNEKGELINKKQFYKGIFDNRELFVFDFSYAGNKKIIKLQCGNETDTKVEYSYYNKFNKIIKLVNEDESGDYIGSRIYSYNNGNGPITLEEHFDNNNETVFKSEYRFNDNLDPVFYHMSTGDFEKIMTYEYEYSSDGFWTKRYDYTFGKLLQVLNRSVFWY